MHNTAQKQLRLIRLLRQTDKEYEHLSWNELEEITTLLRRSLSRIARERKGIPRPYIKRKSGRNYIMRDSEIAELSGSTREDEL